MLAVLSPAKTLDMASPLPEGVEPTQARLLDEATPLVDRLLDFSPPELAELMDISPKLADLNHERFAQWSRPFTTENARPAVLAFQGDVYQGLDAASLSPEDLAFSQDRLRILSGLYGVLRPLDLMQAYRLEMGTKLNIGEAHNLYQYWGSQLGRLLATDLQTQGGDPTLINLASQEYFKAVDTQVLPGPVIDVQFKEARDGKLRTVAVYAKKARGLMARFIVAERLATPEGLKAFDWEGYHFAEEHSDAHQWIFVR